MKPYIFILFLYAAFCHSQVQIGQDINESLYNNNNNNNNYTHSTKPSISYDGNTIAYSLIEHTNINNILEYNVITKVYKLFNNVWTQIGQDIVVANSITNGYAPSILSGDGKTIAIVNVIDNINFISEILIYELKSGVWINTSKIPSINHNSQYLDIDISNDGKRIIIGIVDENNNLTGKVKVYENKSNIWTQLGSDIIGNTPTSTTSTTIIKPVVTIHPYLNVIACTSNYGDYNQQINVYTLNTSNNWVQLGNDFYTNSHPNYNNIYSNISLSLASTTNNLILAIGNPKEIIASNLGYGDVKILAYNHLTNKWFNIGQTITYPTKEGYFGRTVKLSHDAKRIAIEDYTSSLYRANYSEIWGFVQIYDYNNNNWQQFGKDIVSKFDERKIYSAIISGNGLRMVSSYRKFDNLINDNINIVKVYDLTQTATVNQLLKSKVTIYPNPTNDILNISIDDNILINSVKIYNTLGQLMLETKLSQIDINQLKNGIYLVQIDTNQGSITEKIIIE